MTHIVNLTKDEILLVWDLLVKRSKIAEAKAARSIEYRLKAEDGDSEIMLGITNIAAHMDVRNAEILLSFIHKLEEHITREDLVGRDPYTGEIN